MNYSLMNSFSKSFYFNYNYNSIYQGPPAMSNFQNNIPYRKQKLASNCPNFHKMMVGLSLGSCLVHHTLLGCQRKLWLSRWSCPRDQQHMQIACVSGRVEIPLCNRKNAVYSKPLLLLRILSQPLIEASFHNITCNSKNSLQLPFKDTLM